MKEFESKINYGNNNVGETKVERETKTANLFRLYADGLIKAARNYGNVVHIENGEGDDDCDVSDLDVLVQLPERFRGHGNKKRAVNVLAEVLELQIFSFRCGWLVRSFHSAFDYLFNNAKKDGEYLKQLKTACYNMVFLDIL